MGSGVFRQTFCLNVRSVQIVFVVLKRFDLEPGNFTLWTFCRCASACRTKHVLISCSKVGSERSLKQLLRIHCTFTVLGFSRHTVRLQWCLAAGGESLTTVVGFFIIPISS